MSTTKLGKMLAICAVFASAFLVVSASAESKARIVRLSDVEGTVQLDRAAGDGFDKAFLNLPVIEGSKLKTGKDGRAEVEFEDGSALRLAPDSEVAFIRLSLGDDGQKFSTVHLVSGTVYADLHPRKMYGKGTTGDQFALKFAGESIAIPDSAHFRLELDGPSKATLAVFKGKVSASGPSGQFEVAEKHGATIDFATNDFATTSASRDGDKASAKPSKDTFEIAKNYEIDPSDGWDRRQTEYHDRYATTASNVGVTSPYGYGMADLNYYGNFMMLPGYGNVWQPFFTSASWSPFQNGGWAFYPGAGYMFVSGYPWGWMPYAYGNWAYAPGYGYVWQPGGWNNYNYLPVVMNAPRDLKIPAAPATGHQTVMVGLGLTANPAEGSSHRLTINPNSAGVGVPRGSVNHLDRVAKKVGETSRPVVVSTVRPEPPASANQPPSVIDRRATAPMGMTSAGSHRGTPTHP